MLTKPFGFDRLIALRLRFRRLLPIFIGLESMRIAAYFILISVSFSPLVKRISELCSAPVIVYLEVVAKRLDCLLVRKNFS